jgi:peptidoglycan-N-acetylglucosamine deacetylase
MKYKTLSLLIPLLFHLHILAQAQKPCVVFSFDDGNTADILTYKGTDWNRLIINQLSQHNIKAVWFVAANKIDNRAGKRLLQQWDSAGHLIANHTYSHLNYNKPSISCAQFIFDIQKCDSLINGYQNYRKIFRFPVLKEGNTIAKRDSICAWIKQNGYRQGWVTIDASDWYINMRLIKRLKEDADADISGYRDYYLDHIMDRARYYNQLSKKLTEGKSNTRYCFILTLPPPSF